ncbi:MAG: nucleotidyltransferase domain-containing protein [Desulfurococcales archaeon]|nr:nucleotidyltransferase domain-containing protein [Desulfurococcales archaeon]
MPRVLNESEIVDGWIVKYRDLLYWVVKGYSHPPGSLVAVPYRTSEGFRIRVESYKVFAQPWLMKWIDCIGREAPLLKISDIIRFYDPFVGYRLRAKELPDAIREFVDILNPEIVGLTGSWLLGFEKEDSDIDLLVYGDRDVYPTLVDLALEGQITSCKRETRLPRIFGFILTDACFKGVRYTLRILRTVTNEGCKKTLIPIASYVGPIRIVDSSDSYRVPAKYSIVLERLGLKAVLETWHTRFMELATGKYHARLSLRADTEKGPIIASPDLEGSIYVG